MYDDLKSAYYLKQKAETLLKNLEDLKVKASIAEAEYNTLKPDYTRMLDDANSKINISKSNLIEELESKLKELENPGKELVVIQARKKVGEIPKEVYREKGIPLENKVKLLKRETVTINKLIDSNCSEDICKITDSPIRRLLRFDRKRIIILSSFILVIALGVFGYNELNRPFGKIGDKLPSVNIVTLDGVTRNLKEYPGRPILIYIWGHWLGPCKGDMDYLHKIWMDKTYSDIVILAIHTPESGYVELLKKFINDNGYTIPVYFRIDEFVAKFSLRNTVPDTFLIDSTGSLINRKSGAFDSLNALKDFIGTVK